MTANSNRSVAGLELVSAEQLLMARSAQAIEKYTIDALNRLRGLHEHQMSFDFRNEEFESARQDIESRLTSYARYCSFGPLEQADAESDGNELNFRCMADSAPVMIWISGTDKLCFWFNKAWLEFTGRGLEQEVGNGWVDGVHPDDVQYCFEHYASHFDRLEPFSMEYRLRRHDGEYRWIVDSGVPRVDENGAFCGYVGACVDIHDVRTISARILNVSRLYATISAANQALVRSKTLEEVVSSVCRACVEQGGFSMAWIGFANSRGDRIEMAETFGVGAGLMKDLAIALNDPVSERNCPLSKAYREDRAVVANELDNLPSTVSWRNRITNLGFKAHIALPLRCDGKVVGVFAAFGSEKGVFDRESVELLTELADNISFALDQHARQVLHRAAEVALSESERRFRQAFTHTPVGMAIFDLSGRYQWVNPAYCRMTGYSKEELRGSGVGEYIRIDDAGGLQALERKMLAEKIDGCRMEQRAIHKDGHPVVLSVHLSLVRDDEGMPLYFMSQCEDITRRKQMERELIEGKDKLRALSTYHQRRLEEERKHIAREIHDELGQLLSLLKMNIGMLRNDSHEASRVREMAGDISSMVDKTIEVVRNVARNLRPSVLDLGLVPAISWLADDFSQRWNIPCRVDARSQHLDLDEMRATAVFRVVQESLTNVARHARAGEVVISIDESDNWLNLRIRDNGVGFDYAVVSDQGKGFGLLGMRERVLGLDGTLDIDSRPDGGTTIAIQIPR